MRLKKSYILLLTFLLCCTHQITKDAGPFGLPNSFKIKSKETTNNQIIYTLEEVDKNKIKLYTFVNQTSFENFQRSLQVKNNFFKNLYKINIEPYFGTIDKDEKCVKKINLSPEIVEDSISVVQAYQFPINKIFGYEICEDEPTVYFGNIFLVYCKNKKTSFEARVFHADVKDNYKELLIKNFCN